MAHNLINSSALIMTDISFPDGKLTDHAIIQEAAYFSDDKKEIAIITDTTPFHPVDFKWPDQPGDKGNLIFNTQNLPILNSIMVAREKGQEVLFFNQEIPFSKDDPTIDFGVAHIVAFESVPELSALINHPVILNVDCEYRHMLSKSHTANHLATLALNKHLKEFWRKEIILDALGNPNFDRQAIQACRLTPNTGKDTFRLGKSLRKKGFETAQFLQHIEQVQNAMNQTLKNWLRTGSFIRIQKENHHLLGRRTWTCSIEGQTVKVSCGGTHVQQLADITDISCSLALTEDQQYLIMTTRVNG